MTMTGGNRRGNAMLEFAVPFAVLCLSMLAVQVYCKRSIQGRLKSSYDGIGQRASRVAQGRDSTDQPTFDQPEDAVGPLFSPRWSNSTLTSTSHQQSRQVSSTEGETTVTILGGSGAVVPPRARGRPAPPGSVTSVTGYDDFSGKRLDDEKLYE
jgi:hypothetical protein